MSKITKKSFIEKELEKYNSEQVELAISCKVIVILKKGTGFGNIIRHCSKKVCKKNKKK